MYKGGLPIDTAFVEAVTRTVPAKLKQATRHPKRWPKNESHCVATVHFSIFNSLDDKVYY